MSISALRSIRYFASVVLGILIDSKNLTSEVSVVRTFAVHSFRGSLFNLLCMLFILNLILSRSPMLFCPYLCNTEPSYFSQV